VYRFSSLANTWHSLCCCEYRIWMKSKKSILFANIISIIMMKTWKNYYHFLGAYWIFCENWRNWDMIGWRRITRIASRFSRPCGLLVVWFQCTDIFIYIYICTQQLTDRFKSLSYILKNKFYYIMVYILCNFFQCKFIFIAL
jgi:hypothetical protein